MINTQQPLLMHKLPSNAVVCLMAPTASGKTALAYELYDTGRFEIVSVDSALIYKDMNIGTAKPTDEELSQYPHHLVNIIDPTQTYSVASFVKDVETLIGEIHNRHKIPLLVGGTMMYYNVLFNGLSPVPETDSAIRADVEAWRQKEGVAALHDYLVSVDITIAKRLKPTDTQRVTRAVEVYKQTGKPLSAWQKLPKVALANNPDQYWLGLAVMPDRAWLHKRIEQRLDIMWASGFFEEVLGLLEKYPLSIDSPAMRCVGYRQVLEYLININHPVIEKLASEPENVKHKHTYHEHRVGIVDTELACEDMKNKALYATRQLAKRQYTWLRNLAENQFKPIDIKDLVFYKCLKEGLNKAPFTHLFINPVSVNQDAINQTSITHTCNGNHTTLNPVNVNNVSKMILSFSTVSDAKKYLFSRL